MNNIAKLIDLVADPDVTVYYLGAAGHETVLSIDRNGFTFLDAEGTHHKRSFDSRVYKFEIYRRAETITTPTNLPPEFQGHPQIPSHILARLAPPTPNHRQWLDLSDEEWSEIFTSAEGVRGGYIVHVLQLVRIPGSSPRALFEFHELIPE